jgi:hypothetical protein
MKKQVFKFLAKANKVILPSFTKKGLKPLKANLLLLVGDLL